MVREQADSQKIQTKADRDRARMKQNTEADGGVGSDADDNDGLNPVS